MRKIGITGGVGSGKSKVLEYLSQKNGVAVYQADIIARELQASGQECYRQIVEHFGTGILGEDGEIDRRILAKLVFQNLEALKVLNGLVHPAVNVQIQKLIESENAHGTKLFVLEAALLTEEFYRTILDEIWYIYAEESVRRERLKKSRNYSDEKITSMIQSQPSEDTFRRVCDKVIDNTGEFEDTIKQIDALLEESRKQE